MRSTWTRKKKKKTPAAFSFILSCTHLLISRPMALERGGGTALPTWEIQGQISVTFNLHFTRWEVKGFSWSIIPVCVCLGCCRRSDRCLGSPGSVHIPWHSPHGAAQGAGRVPGENNSFINISTTATGHNMVFNRESQLVNSNCCKLKFIAVQFNHGEKTTKQ